MQLMNPYKINDNVIDMNLYMNSRNKMKAETHFPEMAEENVTGAETINTHFIDDAMNQQMYLVEQILKSAAEDNPYTLDNCYGWKSQYQVTYNKAPFISIYSDRYQITGGAHGLTLRKAESWNADKGKPIALQDFFPDKNDYQALIQDEIIRQIGEIEKKTPGTYFEDCSNLVKEYFKPGNFYLKAEPLSIVIFFQQYEIAPYSTGIPEFSIPVKEI